MKKKPTNKEKYQSAVLDLYRKILDGIALESIDFDKKLQGQERIDFLKYCDLTYKNPFFGMIIANVVFPSLINAAKVAESYDVVTFNRATSNGASLVEEFFRKRSEMYEIEFLTPEEKNDPYSAFKPVGPPKLK